MATPESDYNIAPNKCLTTNLVIRWRVTISSISPRASRLLSVT